MVVRDLRPVVSLGEAVGHLVERPLQLLVQFSAGDNIVNQFLAAVTEGYHLGSSHTPAISWPLKVLRQRCSLLGISVLFFCQLSLTETQMPGREQYHHKMAGVCFESR